MQNYIAKAVYDGTNFHGFQRQDNAVTVQETIENALFKLFGAETEIFGCSRTDAGVHALEYIFNFFSNTQIPPGKMVMAINHKLNRNEISVMEIKKAAPDFHARYSNKGKRYLYNIRNSRIKNPFTVNYSWYVPQKLNFDSMKAAAKYFVGTYDFSAFMSSGSSVKNTVRTITDCTVSKNNIWKEQIEIEVEANGFLYNMVRIIAGTLVDVGRGKINAEDIPSIIENGDREAAGVTAPACGLFLKKVFY